MYEYRAGGCMLFLGAALARIYGSLFLQGSTGHSETYWLLPWSCFFCGGRRLAVDHGLPELWPRGP